MVERRRDRRRPPTGRFPRRREARPRLSPYYGYFPIDPAHMACNDGIVFVKDVPQG
ncbi:hypothetical protein ACFQZ2_02770 [Streptomonospora algeriensis]|uniref:Uncharacterized protein n=1 Tax=Streptomonospora algeriensis TaxID=995084 RepID=A0ABW3BAM8_9ACTN